MDVEASGVVKNRELFVAKANSSSVMADSEALHLLLLRLGFDTEVLLMLLTSIWPTPPGAMLSTPSVPPAMSSVRDSAGSLRAEYALFPFLPMLGKMAWTLS